MKSTIPLTSVLGNAEFLQMILAQKMKDCPSESVESIRQTAARIAADAKRIAEATHKLGELDAPILTSHPVGLGEDVSMIDLSNSE